MSAPHQENNVDSKPRARANTSFGALAWRRNKPDSSASVSLASSPAAPIQTLPIDTLIQFLTPPAVPSLNHARSLVTALSTQTPPPPPATLVPILANLCGTVGPSSLHAVGFDILAAYCTCGGGLATSDRLIYFDIMHDASNFWSQEAWESRLKAMNALIPSADEAIGVENKLLQMLTRWVNQSIDDYCSSDVDKQEKERAVEILSDALIGWFDRLESSGRMSGGDALFLFEFHQALVYKVLKLPPGAMQQSPPPALGQRENSSPNINSPSRHRRHPSSATNFASPLSNISPHLQRSAYRNPVHFVASIYLNFLDSQLSHLPPSFLPNLMPLLFRILSSGMSPLPLMSIHTPALFKSQSIEGRVVKTIEALLSGPYTTTCLLLLRKLLSPSLPVDRSTYYDTNPEIQVETSLGALRMLHLQIRRVLEDHMAMRFMQRDMSFSATHAGTPGSTSALDQQFIERAQRAWKMEGAGIWDARTVGFFLCKSIRAWIFYPLPTEKERIFEEVAGLLRDVLQELEDRGEDRATTLDNDFNDNDTAGAVGRALYEMTTYVNTLQNSDGSPMLLPLAHASSASTPLLRILADILGRDHTVYYLNPPLPIILLSVADHLTDADSKKIPVLMVEQHQLKPTSSDWLDNWAKLLGSRNIFVRARPLTRRAVMVSLQSVFSLIKDMPAYRRRLAGVIFDFWMRLVEEGNEGADGAIVWRLLGDEIGLRAVEDDITELFTPTEESSTSMSDITIHKIMVAMMSVSGYCDCDGEVEVIVKPADVVPVSPLIPLTPSDTAVSSAGSPVSSKMATDAHGSGKDKESGSNMQQQIMSLLSFGGSRSQSQYQIPQSQSLEDTMPAIHFGESSPQSTSPEVAIVPCRGLVAVTAFINVFTQLAFVDSVMTERQTSLTIFVFRQLLKLLRTAHCPRARVTILQALMRLRADRDHRIFFVSAPSETENQISSLARLVGRIRDPLSRGSQTDDSRIDETFVDRARAKQIFERDGRRTSRGRGSRAGTGSRSRSRVPGANTVQRMTPVNIKLRDQLWSIPDFVPFSLENAGKGSQLLVSYDPEGPNQSVVLPISDYMDVLVEILKTERDWEVLSYVLVHLPVQLANKHFWCGPFAKESTEKLLSELCKSLTDGTLGKYVPQEEWPGTLKARDAQGLAYHTLTVLISYQSIFDANKRHALVEIFQAGLSGKGETVVVCTHALTLCLFEMETTMVKMLSRILEKFSQIVSNPSMAVHILTFLSILASLPHIYSNFTDNDFKMVFGVALQYLQHHNRVETLSEFQFSLSQHVRIMSYYILYIWFLALKLADRPRHVQFIARQLLLANEGRDEVDDPTEVCFDFLARYTYANADPKPAPSLLGEILSDPAGSSLNVEVVQEKTWIVGFSIVTIRLLAKAGWFEVISRRASGMTKFLCKNENVPLVGLGDMNPDMVTIPTSLMMDKDPRTFGAIITPSELSPSPEVPNDQQNGELMVLLKPPVEVEDESGPDSTTGYVWSATAPSQRRKHVDMDPSYFPLQLSAYPDIRSKGINGKIVRDARALGLTLRTLDLTPVIDTHKVGILYVAPGQTDESKILLNTRGSPAYTRFLKGIGRLIKLRSQVDVYTGGLNPDEDGEYAYAWWDDTGQVLYHTATMMPNHPHDIRCNYKKRHIGNDLVRIVWNDSGLPYRFDTLSSEFQFVNIVIEPHSRGAIAAYANNEHENEYFRLSVQCAEGMAEFAPIGDFKIVSARSLSILVRQISLVADWYASIFKDTYRDTERNEIVTNWRARLEIIKRFMNTIPSSDNAPSANQEIMDQESFRDFTLGY